MPPLLGALVGTFASSLFLIGLIFFFNLYAQAVVTLDYSAVTASLALLPFGFSMFVASLLVGRVVDRFGFRWPVAAGMGLMGIGGPPSSGLDGGSDYGDVWWAITIVGVGVGVTFLAPSAAGLKALPPENAGEASGDHQCRSLRKRGAGDLARHDRVRPGRLGRAQQRTR